MASDPDDPNTANGKIVYSFPDDGTIVRDLFTIDSNTGTDIINPISPGPVLRMTIKTHQFVCVEEPSHNCFNI